MRHVTKVVPMRNALFQRVRKTITDFNNHPALLAYKMMMVPVIVATKQFIARRAVAEIKAFHHPHGFQQVKRAVDGRQIAKVTEFLVDFARAGRMFLAPQQVQDELARSCDASMVASEASCEFGKILLMPLHDQCA